MVARAALRGGAGRELQKRGVFVGKRGKGLAKDLTELGLLAVHVVDVEHAGAGTAFAHGPSKGKSGLKKRLVAFGKKATVLPLLHDELLFGFGVDEDGAAGGAEIVRAEIDDDKIKVARLDVIQLLSTLPPGSSRHVGVDRRDRLLRVSRAACGKAVSRERNDRNVGTKRLADKVGV